MRLQLRDNRRAGNGEFNGVGDIRLPGRDDVLPLHVWNLEHIFDGAHHQGNKPPPEAHIFEPRQAGARIDLLRISESVGVLYQPPTPYWGLESATVVSLVDGQTIDVSFCARLTRPVPQTSWFGLFWASYPSLQDAPLFFPGRTGEKEAPRWIEGRSEKHLVRNTWIGEGSHPGISFVAGYPDKLYTTMAEAKESWSWPVAYARPAPETTFVMMLASDHGLRLTQSPLSAWDAQMIVHDWKLNEDVELRARLLLDSLTPDAVIEAYEAWSGEDLPALGPVVRSEG